jgi:hypothetical protein
MYALVMRAAVRYDRKQSNKIINSSMLAVILSFAIARFKTL